MCSQRTPPGCAAQVDEYIAGSSQMVPALIALLISLMLLWLWAGSPPRLQGARSIDAIAIGPAAVVGIAWLRDRMVWLLVGGALAGAIQ